MSILEIWQPLGYIPPTQKAMRLTNKNPGKVILTGVMILRLKPTRLWAEATKEISVDATAASLLLRSNIGGHETRL